MAQKVEPAKQRSTITASEHALVLTIPPRPRPVDVLLGLCVAFFVFSTVSLAYRLFVDLLAGETKSVLLGLAFSVLMGMLAAFLGYVFLWRVVGKESVRASSDTLAVSLHVAGMKRAFPFDARQIQHLRATPPTRDPHAGALGIGTIAFEYGAKTYRFGFAVDEAEARVLAAAIRQACGLGDDASLASPALASHPSPTS
ncbi:MAG: hypothetical protein WEE64_01945 [Dehalococcoidia bacterium]